MVQFKSVCIANGILTQSFKLLILLNPIFSHSILTPRNTKQRISEQWADSIHSVTSLHPFHKDTFHRWVIWLHCKPKYFMPCRPGKLTLRALLMEHKHRPNFKRPVFPANESTVIITECHQTPGGGGRWRDDGRRRPGVRFGGREGNLSLRC